MFLFQSYKFTKNTGYWKITINWKRKVVVASVVDFFESVLLGD